MQLIPHVPRPPLSMFVELIWFVRGKPDYLREKVLPNGALELIINLGPYHKVVDEQDPARFRVYKEAWVAGMQEGSLLIEAFDESDLVGVRFKPGMAAPFLRLSPEEFTNRVIECEELFGGLLQEVRERLLETASPGERVRLLEDMLLRRLDQDWAPDPVVALALRELGRGAPDFRVASLSRRIGISHKQLISRFRREVGLAPKLLAQVARFQSVLRAVRGLGTAPWADVAQRCGYHDQAHLIREFRRFSGTTPGQYLRHRDDDENHILIRGAPGARG